ncbi:flavin-containing monooxygenase [Antribacter gilvus]|uniref:flavin-containing monooxygenase n=1 Tax=Antribacter gilvus TaxID=2304675 RepID=UPI00198199E8|nr:NAD(P)/FAD-dependent oxidoreductase [Antribacter gilvus]
MLILERADRVGTSWARRWDSLRLFTPARYDALPGAVFPGPPWSYPGKDDVARYLAGYAARFSLPVLTGAEAAALDRSGDGFDIRLTDGRVVAARQVVVATGAFGTPWIPTFAAGLDPHVLQVHTDDYRNPAQVPPGPVLVVGGGNSGIQIALELALTGRDVHLSGGTRPRVLPQRPAGRDLFWWLTVSGAIHAPAASLVGRRLRANEPVIGTARGRLRRAGVTFRPCTTAARANTLTFADGTDATPASVVWATGYRHDDRWITIADALDTAGALIVDDAATPVPGLYALGRPWQRSRGSALLGYVRHDAQRLAATIAAEARRERW